MDVLCAAGCRRMYVDGSFVTAKEAPADFDACWEIDGVDFSYLARHAPVLLHPFQMRTALRAAFGGDLFPARVTADALGRSFFVFFQQDSRTEQAKGMIALELEGDG